MDGRKLIPVEGCQVECAARTACAVKQESGQTQGHADGQVAALEQMHVRGMDSRGANSARQISNALHRTSVLSSCRDQKQRPFVCLIVGHAVRHRHARVSANRCCVMHRRRGAPHRAVRRQRYSVKARRDREINWPYKRGACQSNVAARPVAKARLTRSVHQNMR